MAREIRIGGVFLDFSGRNARFLTAARKNQTALQRQRAAVRQLNSTIARFNARARAMRQRLFSLRGVIGTLASAAVLGAVIKRTSQYGATLVEVSQRLGLTVERVQLLQRVFQAEGVQQNAVNIGLQRFTRRLADAAGGNKILAETFRRLGTPLRDTQGRLRDSYSVLLDVADGLRSTANQQERVRLAFQLFDTEGVAFVNVLQRGADALVRNQDQMRRFGVVTTQQAEDLKALDQTLQDLGTTLRVGFARVVSENGERLTRLVNILVTRLPDAFRQLTEITEVLARNFNLILAAVGALVAARILIGFATLVSHAQALNVATKEITGSGAFGLLTRLIPTLAAIPAAGIAAAGGLSIFVDIYTKLQRAEERRALLTTTLENLRNLDDPLAAINARLNELNDAFLRAATPAPDAFGNVSRGQIEAARHITGQLREQIDALVSLRNELLASAGSDDPPRRRRAADLGSPRAFNIVRGLRRRVPIPTTSGTTARQVANVRDYSEALRELRDELIRQSPAYEGWLANLRRIDEGFLDAGRAFETFATNLTRGVSDLGDSFRDFTRNLVAELTRILIFRPLFEALAQFGINRFGTGRVEAGQGRFADAFLATFQRRQHGGPVAAGRGYIVGEDGPEPFVPPGAGRILPNSALGGQFVFAPRFYVESTDGPGVEAALARAIPVLERIGRAKMAQELSRPSATRSLARKQG